MNAVALWIGDISLKIISEDYSLIQKIIEQYGNYLNKNEEFSYCLEIDVISDIRKFTNTRFPVSEIGEYNCLEWFFSGHVDKNYNALLLVPQEGAFKMFEVFIIKYFSLICIRNKSILLHAAAVENNHGIHLFVGPSGAGKTTISELCKGGIVISDDLVMIKQQEFGTFFARIPFARDKYKERLENIYNIKGIYFLSKNKYNKKSSIASQFALAKIIPQILHYDAQQYSQIIDLASDLVQNNRTYNLDFLPDSSVWEILI